jgi:protein-S-isoprenylcysteine O-methyltransferase Ste14
MSGLVLLGAVWAVLGVTVLVRLAHDYTRGNVSPLTAFLLWPWHGLNYFLLIVLSTERVWAVDLPGAVIAGGAGLIVVGMVIIVAGFYEFRSIRRLSGTQQDRLVTTGIYRFSRHPQYLGIILTLLGGAVAGQSAAAGALAVALGLGLVLYLPIEEHYVERAFGERYLRYRDQVPRLVRFPGR